MDDNGVYIAVDHLGPTHASIVAIQKAALLASPPTLNSTYFRNLQHGAIQPAVNFDPVSATGPAWFVAHRLFTNQDIVYATLTWNSGIPTLSNWTTLSTPAFGSTQPIPTKGSANMIYILGFVGALQPSAIRNVELWTCRTVGVNSTGGATSPDRNGCEWIRLSLSGTTATLVDSGRVYDGSTSNPKFYFHSSIMVNSRGDAVMGFSGAGANDYIGAFASGRLASDPLTYISSVKTLKAGETVHNTDRWGDYSHTTLDPTDSLAIWTVQQYARTPSSNWRTWIGEIMPVKP